MQIIRDTQWWNAARDRIKEVLDGPDTDIDRIIRAVLENGNQVPADLQTEYPQLRDPETLKTVEKAVASPSTERLPRAW